MILVRLSCQVWFCFGLVFLLFYFSSFWPAVRVGDRRQTPLANLLWSFQTCKVSTLCPACEHLCVSAAAWTQSVNIVEMSSPKPFYAPTCLLFVTGLKLSLCLPLKCLASEFFSNHYCSFSMCAFQLTHYLFCSCPYLLPGYQVPANSD